MYNGLDYVAYISYVNYDTLKTNNKKQHTKGALKMGKIKNINSIPTWESRAFGVEIEFVYKPQSGHSAMRPALARNIQSYANLHIQGYNVENNNSISQVEIRGEHYNHNTQTYWKLVTDSTANPTTRQSREGYIGNYELVSPILKGINAKIQLKYILQAMQELGCDVSRHCGLHVHHDVREWKRDLQSNNGTRNDNAINRIVNVVTLFTKFEDIIFGMLPNSRKPGGSNYRWCRSINAYMNNVFSHVNGKNQSKRSDKKKVVKDANRNNHFNYNFQSDRFCGLNFGSFYKYGSIEVRYGAPTLNFEKMFNWIIFTQRFVIAAELFKTVNSGSEMKLETEHDKYITFIKVRDSLCLTRRMCKTEEELNASLWIRKRFNENYATA